MQVKIMDAESIGELETMINDYLKKNSNLNFVDIKLDTYVYDKQRYHNAMIIYN